MKCALLVLIFMTGTAFANDGGLVYVDVKGIDPVKKETSLNTQVMEFYGADTEKFMQLLPPAQSVESTYVEGFSETFKALAFVSGGYVLRIDCASGEIVYDEDMSNPRIVKFKDGGRCTIGYNKRVNGDDLWDYLGAPTPLDKDSMVCEQK